MLVIIQHNRLLSKLNLKEKVFEVFKRHKVSEKYLTFLH